MVNMEKIDITEGTYKNAILTSTCIRCRRGITGWGRFCRLFGAPWLYSMSIFWKVCCSRKCWGLVLDSEMEKLKKI